MKMPKKMSDGQVDQQNYEPSGVDMPEKNAETGPVVKMGFVDGKQGSVEKKGMVQTACTMESGGGSMDGK